MPPTLTWTLDGIWDAGGKRSPGRAPARGVAQLPLADLDERALVDACLAGRSGAFDLIVQRHQRTVYQLCYRFAGNHEDASDLSQDVFLRAYRGLRTFRGDAALATWLHRIGVNVCLNRAARRVVPTEPLEDAGHVDLHAEPATDVLLRRERAVHVRSAITRLPRMQRATLILRVYHEMSHQEIAETLGCSIGAAKANVFHALRGLRRLLGGAVD